MLQIYYLVFPPLIQVCVGEVFILVSGNNYVPVNIGATTTYHIQCCLMCDSIEVMNPYTSHLQGIKKSTLLLYSAIVDLASIHYSNYRVEPL